MIPDIAVIISAYAVTRLMNEYVFEGPKAQAFRVILSFIAIGVIGFFLLSVLDSSASLNI